MAKRRNAKVEEFTLELGRVLGTARAKADHWLGQRREIVKHLTDVRDAASRLLADLGHEAGRIGQRANREVHVVVQEGARKRRTLSAAARKAISDAQKRRWAAVRGKKKP